MSCHFFAVFVKMKDSRCAEEFVSASPILTGRIRTLDVLGNFGLKMSAIFSGLFGLRQCYKMRIQ